MIFISGRELVGCRYIHYKLETVKGATKKEGRSLIVRNQEVTGVVIWPDASVHQFILNRVGSISSFKPNPIIWP